MAEQGRRSDAQENSDLAVIASASAWADAASDWHGRAAPCSSRPCRFRDRRRSADFVADTDCVWRAPHPEGGDRLARRNEIRIGLDDREVDQARAERRRRRSLPPFIRNVGGEAPRDSCRRNRGSIVDRRRPRVCDCSRGAGRTDWIRGGGEKDHIQAIASSAVRRASAGEGRAGAATACCAVLGCACGGGDFQIPGGRPRSLDKGRSAPNRHRSFHHRSAGQVAGRRGERPLCFGDFQETGILGWGRGIGCTGGKGKQLKARGERPDRPKPSRAAPFDAIPPLRAEPYCTVIL